jgi:hypothetical protein
MITFENIYYAVIIIAAVLYISKRWKEAKKQRDDEYNFAQQIVILKEVDKSHPNYAHQQTIKNNKKKRSVLRYLFK